MQTGIDIIVGPSAVGKSTVINALLKRHSNWSTVGSYTTRAKRVNEDDSKRYTFVSRAEFARLKQAGDILEAEENDGNWYGTSRASLLSAQASSEVVLLDLRFAGAAFIKQQYPHARSIYIYAPVSEVRRRLEADPKRVNEPAEIRAQRLANVAQLNRQRHSCDVVITSIPNEIEKTVDLVEAAIRK